jgi:CRISPR-associated protein Csm1
MKSKLAMYHLVFAALMHDIGKVIQRTGVADKWESRKHLDKCVFPPGQQYATYKHVMYTAEFLERYSLPLKDWETVVEIAGCHHNDSVFQHTEYSCFLNYLIEADRTASSWDREKGEENNNDKQRYKKAPLYSIFDQITLTKDNQSQEKHYYKLAKRSADALLSPRKQESPLVLLTDQYNEIWTGFLAEFEQVYHYYLDLCKKRGEDFIEFHYSQYIDAVESLMEQYFWCVPANTNELYPTNSLYHHSRNTATIAASLLQANEYYGLSRDNQDKTFRILLADLNGIQSYLFGLNPEKVTKTSKLLRSRSFQINILMDLIAYKIVNELSLSRLNIFMNVGGKWAMVIPNSEDVTNKLMDVKKAIENELFERYMGRLSVNLNWETEASLDDLNKYNFSKTLETCLSIAEKEKYDRFSTCLKDNGGWLKDRFIVNEDPLYNSNICSYCYRRSDNNNHNADGDEKVCLHCYNEIQLGEQLVKKSVYAISYSSSGSEQGLINFSDLEFKAVSGDTGEIRLKPSAWYFRINEKSLNLHIPLRQIANSVPKHDDDSLLTFEEIAERGRTFNEETGNHLGIIANAVVKGDVDNLGLIFQSGLLKSDKNGRPYCSITDYTTLSSMIDYFFSVYVPYVIRRDFADSIYTVYAGGDDFCLIGAYNKIIDFVIRMNEDFRSFTSRNPDLHFSASIVLMHPKEPVRFAINIAEDKLKLAKRKNIGKERKNKLYVFETIVPWHKVAELVSMADKFEQFLDEEKIKMQFLYRLFQYHNMYRESKKAQTDIRNLLYSSLLSYDINRNIANKIKSRNDNTDAAEFFRRFCEISEESEMEYLRIPLCKTIYGRRKIKGGEDV